MFRFEMNQSIVPLLFCLQIWSMYITMFISPKANYYGTLLPSVSSDLEPESHPWMEHPMPSSGSSGVRMGNSTWIWWERPLANAMDWSLLPKTQSTTLNRAGNAVNRILLRGQCPNVHYILTASFHLSCTSDPYVHIFQRLWQWKVLVCWWSPQPFNKHSFYIGMNFSFDFNVRVMLVWICLRTLLLLWKVLLFV